MISVRLSSVLGGSFADFVGMTFFTMKILLIREVREEASNCWVTLSMMRKLVKVLISRRYAKNFLCSHIRLHKNDCMHKYILIVEY